MIFKYVMRPDLSRRNPLAVLGALVVFPFLSLGQTGPVGPTPVPQVPETKPAPQGPAKVNTPGTPGAPAPAATGSGGAPVDSNSYKVGPADVLNVRVWDEEKFTGPVTVQRDGKITLPLVGQLQAGGLTPVEIQDVIAKSLTKYVVKPLVTVS